MTAVRGGLTLQGWDDMASDEAQCELLAALVRAHRPEVVVETGTYRGHGTLYMADALRRNGRGHLHTADPFWHGVPEWIERNGLASVATFHHEQAHKLIERLPYIDFAYIDDHAHSRHRHFEMCRAKLRPGGIILVDDTNANDWHEVDTIRRSCTVNFRFLRGLSVYYP